MSQAQPSPKQLNLKSLAMQGDSKIVAIRRRKIRVFEVERVYGFAKGFRPLPGHRAEPYYSFGVGMTPAGMPMRRLRKGKRARLAPARASEMQP